jgi:hypothetical protein
MSERIPEASEFRQRIVHEDDLLNSRTIVFIATNGLLMTAVGVSDDFAFRLVISILGIIITISWMILSWQNWNVIRQLTIEYRKHYSENHIENIVQKAMLKPGWRRPTDLIAKPIPIMFLITWIVLLLIHGLKLL